MIHPFSFYRPFFVPYIVVFIFSSSNEDDKEKSNEPDYDEDEDQLEEVHEEQTAEITIMYFEHYRTPLETNLMRLFHQSHTHIDNHKWPVLFFPF